MLRYTRPDAPISHTRHEEIEFPRRTISDDRGDPQDAFAAAMGRPPDAATVLPMGAASASVATGRPVSRAG
jgi:hypothetical protein